MRDDLYSIISCCYGCYGYILLAHVQRIKVTADGKERKYLMRDLNIIKMSNIIETIQGCPYIVNFYGVLLKEVSCLNTHPINNVIHV